MICGDFNEILDAEENSWFEDNPSNTTCMRDFQDLTQSISVSGLGFHGPRLTWCNKRTEGLICKKLDRVLVNADWWQTFPNSYSAIEDGGCSNHSRGRIIFDTTGGDAGYRRKPFKFFNVLTTSPQFLDVVGSYWSSTTPIFESTSAIYRFTKKLKALKPSLRVLSKENLGDIQNRAKDAYQKLCLCQAKTLSEPSSTNIDAELEVYSHWKNISDLEESYLKQKSKVRALVTCWRWK